jgi:cytochrome c biogenesis protein
MQVMNRIRQFLLSRTTILTLIILASGSMLLASFIPQSFLLTTKGTAKWHSDHPTLAMLAEHLGLQHIYTHPFFACTILLISGSLFFSGLEQFKIARRLTFDGVLSFGTQEEFVTVADPGSVTRWLRQGGYLAVAGLDGSVRLCRHPWGYWGNFLLHMGMLIVIVSSLWIALTQQRGMLHLAVGESFHPGEQWLAKEKGLLAKDFVLDRSVRLESVSYEFWPTYGVKDVSSRLSFQDRLLPGETVAAGVNSILHYQGLSIYQAVEFGHAFYLEIVDSAGTKNTYQLLLNHPEKPDRPSYGEYPTILGSGRVLRAKYFVDPEKRSFDNENPLLVLRLDENGTQLGQLPLQIAGEGSIDRVHFRLLKVDKWSGLIVTKLSGIWGVFLGFIVIIIGSTLNYFTPPRDAIVKILPGGGSRVLWRAAKFSDFYRDEFNSLEKQFTMEGQNG